MKKKYHFVYITTNLIDNKQYLGKHSTDNLDDGYLGSGKILQKAIKRYGKESFKREILEFCESSKEAYNKEIELSLKYNVRDNDNFYNLTDGGEGNNFWKDKKRSVNDRTKMSNAQKKYFETHDVWNKNLPTELNPNTGKKYSKEHCENISKANTGRIVSEDTLLKLSESHKGQRAWNKGLVGIYKASKETKAKMSASNKGKGVKPVLQFDLDGNLIKEWGAVTYIDTFPIGGVIDSCKNNIPYKGFIWKYKNILKNG